MTLEQALRRIEAAFPGLVINLIEHVCSTLHVHVTAGSRDLHIWVPMHDASDLDRVLPSLMLELEEYSFREGMI